MDDLPPADEALRERLNTRLREEGHRIARRRAAAARSAYWEQVDRSNPARVLRALEVVPAIGTTRYSSLRTGRQHTRPFAVTKIGIDLPRPELYARIDRRVELMIGEGLEEEARRLYPFRHLTALQTVRLPRIFPNTSTATSHATRRSNSSNAIRAATPNGSSRGSGRDPAIRWFAPNDDRAILDYIDSTAAAPAASGEE